MQILPTSDALAIAVANLTHSAMLDELMREHAPEQYEQCASVRALEAELKVKLHEAQELNRLITAQLQVIARANLGVAFDA